MEHIKEWLANAGTPDWDLILRFADVLSWPFVVFLALVTIRPGRLIDAILERGGEVSAGGAAFKLEKRIDRISEEIRAEPEAHFDSPPDVSQPPEGVQDAYSTVMAGWGKIAEKLEEVLGYSVKRDPMSAVSDLRRRDKIGTKIQHQLEEMWGVRNQVKSAGSKKTNRDLTQSWADDYYESAAKLVRSISNAIAYRERRANGIGAQGELKLVPSGNRPDGQPLH